LLPSKEPIFIRPRSFSESPDRREVLEDENLGGRGGKSTDDVRDFNPTGGDEMESFEVKIG
jgi:hypothetical protein